jgi:DNA-directed RNA polymerase beta' subunit
MLPIEDKLRGFSRRTAEIPIPGLTEPQIVSNINIPIVPINTSISDNPVQVTRRRNRIREDDIQEGEIENVEFNLFTTEEIDAYAVVNVTDPGAEGENTVSDLRMGPHTEGSECPTCGSDLRGCPGHMGKIVIPRIMHPMVIDTIILVLSCICRVCSRVLVTQQDIINAGINNLRDKVRLVAILELIQKIYSTQKNIRTCQHGVFGHGGIGCDKNPIYKKSGNKSDHRLSIYRKVKTENVLIGYFLPDLPNLPPQQLEAWKNIYRQTFRLNQNIELESIYNTLNLIPNEDAQLLGFNYNSHPRTMIMDRLIVIPYCARPDMFQGELYAADDITKVYRAIAKEVITYNTAPDITKQESSISYIFKLIKTLMKNDSKLNQGNLSIQSDIRSRINGKSGIIRGNLMGKRVNFAGRTVLGPGHYLRVDEIGVPRLMAVKLTRPIKVYEANRAEMQAKYDNGRVTYIVKQNGRNDAGFLQEIGDRFRQKYPNYQLQIGDIVHRMLEDGDLILVNRQPSLHKQNILGLYTRIIDDRIVRINLSITTPLGADYDGDEVNIHVPQTIEAYAEAEQLLAVYHNLMTAQTNKPMIGLVYDTLSGAYLLSYPEEQIERLDKERNKLLERSPKIPIEIQAAQLELQQAEPDSEEYVMALNQIEYLQNELAGIPSKITEHIKRQAVLRERVDINPVVFNRCIDAVINTPQFNTLEERLNRYGVNHHGGRALLSATFPEDFDYNANGVVIKNGILTKGLLTKDVLGNKDGSIIAEMVKQLGGFITVDFMSNLQFLIQEYLQQRGLSVGIDDCMPNDPEFRKNLDEALTNAKMKVISLSSVPTNKIIAEQQERKIQEVLGNVKSNIEKNVQKNFHPDNALLIMANSGAKGTSLNSVQISSILGMQKVSGKRIQANLTGNRALPSIQPGSKDPADRGFCVNSFSSGLTPKEFFFHAQGGREGITDTATNTAQTGYLQHQIVKSAEDIHVSSDGSVRAADNGIMQFIYGDDGCAGDEIGNIKIHGENVPMFRNLSQLADKINRKYGS